MKYPNIEAERARRNLSYEDMAAKLDVSRKTLYNWITKGKIPQKKVEDMAVFFRCSADYLLSHEIGKENGRYA